MQQQVSSILAAARPKLQKWISDAQADDPESLDTFLQINDQINTVLNRYEAFKKGDYATSSNPIPAELSGHGAANDLSLIDFNDSAPSSANPVSLGSGIDDLGDLFAEPTPAPASARVPIPRAVPSNGNGYGMNMLLGSSAPGISRPTISPPSLSSTPPASIMLPGTPGPAPAVPNYFGSNAYAATGPVRGAGMGMGAPSGSSSIGMPAGLHMQKPPPASNATGIPNQQQQGKDPFADLAGLF